ncbi:MAG: hypothetical protein K9N07_10365 [Candidatus Cloacimonetes bacterium]|nr:hypothetical protein [Candidatus Cloacimonadota bacterium]MCF8012743.1 hypothetical protein [Candidatus Woesearchaeota archaeon]
MAKSNDIGETGEKIALKYLKKLYPHRNIWFGKIHECADIHISKKGKDKYTKVEVKSCSKSGRFNISKGAHKSFCYNKHIEQSFWRGINIKKEFIETHTINKKTISHDGRIIKNEKYEIKKFYVFVWLKDDNSYQIKILSVAQVNKLLNNLTPQKRFYYMQEIRTFENPTKIRKNLKFPKDCVIENAISYGEKGYLTKKERMKPLKNTGEKFDNYTSDSKNGYSIKQNIYSEYYVINPKKIFN